MVARGEATVEGAPGATPVVAGVAASAGETPVATVTSDAGPAADRT
jgi:hypothetical protein